MTRNHEDPSILEHDAAYTGTHLPMCMPPYLRQPGSEETGQAEIFRAAATANSNVAKKWIVGGSRTNSRNIIGAKHYSDKGQCTALSRGTSQPLSSILRWPFHTHTHTQTHTRTAASCTVARIPPCVITAIVPPSQQCHVIARRPLSCMKEKHLQGVSERDTEHKEYKIPQINHTLEYSLVL